MRLWYRPPELLYGGRAYSTGVDMWTVGCIFAELMLRTPCLAGENVFDQSNTIFCALRMPTDQDWPDWQTMLNSPNSYFNSTPYPTCPQNLPKPKGALVPRQFAPQDNGAGGADGRNENGLKKQKSVVTNLNKDVDIQQFFCIDLSISKLIKNDSYLMTCKASPYQLPFD
ncbi:hypothetical protein PSHT_00797 [Puccinia striiformis]|uniref:[RNA-polymerase]-subunit kinase n=1 Tax=Puccinia striiformis TaxID=27350 RepID=A0A2S4WM74_9BASI|nr:hypothetical protein PSHT_00797 [Puccinia striiformis]